MLDTLIDDVVDVTPYQRLRAVVATLNNAALLASGVECSAELRAEAAIDAAEELLDQLGFVDPDTVGARHAPAALDEAFDSVEGLLAEIAD